MTSFPHEGGTLGVVPPRCTMGMIMTPYNSGCITQMDYFS
jgi:hypothetical protein